MTTATWTKAEAKASDREYARLVGIAQAASAAVDTAHERALTAAGASMQYLNGGYRRKGLSFDRGRTEATLDQARAIASGKEQSPSRYADVERAAEAVARYDAAVVEYREANAAARAWDDAHYQGWRRFFLVPGGHIHESTACSSLRITTMIVWLPELSGETEAEAVAEHGALLCTKCFPSAPVEWTVGNVDPDKCNGRPDMDRRRGRYAPCRECGYVGHITTHGNLRKHKRESA
ncbi:hypothetical protein TM4_40 [Mycobacterium phage TM4]|uniref:Uncharacterized protein n=1 Tax=Mycobacterium phage TM4 TaxID=88870 RepID=Q9ZX38_BPMT4|nr:hypothetical protein TM4_gp40 [Mycobacterium phage TM4]AAD17607.1 hypothetical protein TM4_40 [Mycobacterium phage TM4]AGK85721.1 hypothetical protein 33D_0039 [Mycobacterium phage 33D]